MKNRPAFATPQAQLLHAAHDLVMQAYGNKKHDAHAPTRVQWLNLASAVEASGVAMPADWERVLGETGDTPTRLRES